MQSKIDDGLVMQFELVARYGVAHVVFEFLAVARLRFHCGLEETISISALGLGPVQSKVGAFDQRIGVIAILRRQCNPYAGFERELAAVEIIGFGDGGAYSLGERDYAVFLILLGRLQHRKFVAAQSADAIDLPCRLLQPAGNLLQQGVAGRMAQRIVHGFEAVEVEHQYRECLAKPAHPRQRRVCLFHEQRPVGETGQSIVARHALELGISMLFCAVMSWWIETQPPLPMA